MISEIEQLAKTAYSGKFNITPEEHANRLALLSVSIEIIQDRVMACEIINKVMGEYLIESEALPSLQNALNAVAENMRAKAESEDAKNNARVCIVAHYVEQALKRYGQEDGTPKFTVIEGGLEDQ